MKTIPAASSCTLVTDPAELEGLAAGWARLAENQPRPFTGYAWCGAAARAFYSSSDLRILVLGPLDDPLAIAPMALAAGSRAGAWELLGASILYEPTELLYRDKEALQLLLTRLLQYRRPLHFGRLPSDSATCQAIFSLPRYRALIAGKADPGGPWTPLEGSFSAYDASPERKMVRAMRRNRRKLEAEGPVSLEVFPGDTDLPGDLALEEMIRIEALSWKGERGTALAGDSRLRGFLTEVAERQLAQGTLRLFFLRVGEARIAAQFGMVYRNRLWAVKIGYAAAWSQCSPGNLLTRDCIRWCYDQGIEGYEILGIDMEWKRLWCPRTHAYTVTRLYPVAARGFAGLAEDVAARVYRAVGGGSTPTR